MALPVASQALHQYSFMATTGIMINLL